MGKKALEGIRVIDFTNGAAGTICTRRLGSFGADVIRVESMEYIDSMRLMSGPGHFHRCAPFTSAGLSKRSIVVNMKEPQGVEIVKRLVSISDLFVENYGFGVVESWGLDYEELQKIRPDIIMLRSPGLGLGGPRSKQRTQGPLISSLSGIYYLWRHPTEIRPIGSQVIHPDFYAANQGVVSILAALDYRAKTGKGQLIDMSQAEVVSSLLGPIFLDYTVNNNVPEPMGNHCSYASPHGVYRCNGDDKWCAIAVFSEDEWKRFCDAIGNLSWTQDARFDNLLGRIAHSEELDKLVEEWTIHYSPYEVMEILQKAGVNACVAQNNEELFYDPQLNERGYITEIDHPQAGKRAYSGIPMKLSETPGEDFPCPMFGQHTHEILRDLLHMSEEEIQELADEGILA
ncbi:MAG: CoA transferase [Thermodesulfobacteriota bacterium]|nr:CoA transferase [Thermodesulfobacteriota bacterium]